MPEQIAPLTPVHQHHEISIDEAVLRMDQERRIRREGIKRGDFQCHLKRDGPLTPILTLDGGFRTAKRQCLFFPVYDEDGEKENEGRDAQEERPTLAQRRGVNVPRLTLRPRSLDSEMNECAHFSSSSSQRMTDFQLPYMPF